ncbi:MAG: adenosylcobinamide-GDP ribazoletransferase [Candidatus Cellulosilyticum pullistercoris]|uniref:Adenosylcobinamide-GDP ribazoletransferase n=1 Tax=Candidatus Cellulosilyticum pullistercoris TaxID=2838521 RepID=A0A9E2KCY4_9FIRM|nr:adenosylcobinamide-GDP ribazoletransferase [Candidatus Cellulosilyticum pullistercoris]
MKRLIGIIQFMTRIPIPIDVGLDEDFHKSTIYFPIVGLVLGICYMLVAKIGLALFNPYITAVLVLASEVILTGGLHIDGLGDSFDGLYSYRDKEKILEIMKDSRLGTNGLLAIVIVFLLKIGFLNSLLEQNILWPILTMPVVARSMQIVASYKTRTPREKGMGNIFIGKVSTSYLIGVIVLMLGINLGSIYLMEGQMLYAIQIPTLLIMVVGVKLFVRSVYKKIDGITGDILGCICELSELVYLIILYMLMF